MSQLNTKSTYKGHTYQGGPAKFQAPLQQLIRVTMANMLWEDQFYIDGQSTANLIQTLVHSVSLEEAARVALEARNQMKLRHVPLLIVREMARHPKLHTNPRVVSETLAEVIQRPDELTEFVSIYWATNPKGQKSLSKQIKLGLAKAFSKFNEYALAKYNRDKDVKLRDVLFLCHSKPADVSKDGHWTKADRSAFANARKTNNDQFDDRKANSVLISAGRHRGFSDGELLYGRVVYDQLASPETWENRLSRGEDKRTTFTALMAENQLGDLAFLRNLRNMTEAGVPKSIITAYGDQRRWGRVLPFRFLSAARILPQFEPELESWMFKCLEGAEKLPGKTVLLIDVSGSMAGGIGGKSDLTRLDAAKALAMLLREVCEWVQVIRFHTHCEELPPRRGFALADAVGHPNGGTALGNAVRVANAQGYDRLIVFTDEQSQDSVGMPLRKSNAYMVNVAAYERGVAFGPWLKVSGFSEAIVDYIRAYEASLGD